MDKLNWENMCTRLTGLQISVAKQLTEKCIITYALHDLDLGRSVKIKHSIPLFDYPTFKLPYHRIPTAIYDDVR